MFSLPVFFADSLSVLIYNKNINQSTFVTDYIHSIVIVQNFLSGVLNVFILISLKVNPHLPPPPTFPQSFFNVQKYMQSWQQAIKLVIELSPLRSECYYQVNSV